MQSIDPTVEMGNNVKIGHYSIVENDVVIGDNVEIGHHVVIKAGTRIGRNVIIEDQAVLGREPRPAKTSTVKSVQDLKPLIIGQNTLIGTHVVIYRGTIIGNDCMIGDLASIREGCNISNNVVIGRGVAIENKVTIKSFTKMQTNAYITAYSELEDHVFIAPTVTTTNDNFMGRTKERFEHIKGAVIKRGARVGGGSILLPGVKVDEESFIAAGAVVTKDTEPKTVYMGVPARKLKKVEHRELLFPD